MITTLRAHGQEIAVSSIGATLMSWTIDSIGDVLDGYFHEEELRAGDGYRSAVLAPWCNRLRDGQWADGQVTRDVRDVAGSEGLHGLCVNREFEVNETESGLLFTTTIEDSPAFPGPLQVAVEFVLAAENTLELTVTADNQSERTIPVALGWHPYFRVASIDESAVDIAAEAEIETDTDGIPLEGEAAYLGFDGVALTPQSDFAVTCLKITDGCAHADLSTGLGHEVRIAFNAGDFPASTLHIFTGGTLNRGAGQSIAIEPCTAMANALNRPSLDEALELQPHQECQLNISLAVAESETPASAKEHN